MALQSKMNRGLGLGPRPATAAAGGLYRAALALRAPVNRHIVHTKAQARAQTAVDPSQVIVKLNVTHPTKWGEQLKVVGSTTELGSWDIDRAPTMNWVKTSAAGELWSWEGVVPHGVHEWKVVVFNSSHKTSVWENIPVNRKLEVPDVSGTLTWDFVFGDKKAAGSFAQTPLELLDPIEAAAALESKLETLRDSIQAKVVGIMNAAAEPNSDLPPSLSMLSSVEPATPPITPSVEPEAIAAAAESLAATGVIADYVMPSVAGNGVVASEVPAEAPAAPPAPTVAAFENVGVHASAVTLELPAVTVPFAEPVEPMAVPVAAVTEAAAAVTEEAVTVGPTGSYEEAAGVLQVQEAEVDVESPRVVAPASEMPILIRASPSPPPPAAVAPTAVETIYTDPAAAAAIASAPATLCEAETTITEPPAAAPTNNIVATSPQLKEAVKEQAAKESAAAAAVTATVKEAAGAVAAGSSSAAAPAPAPPAKKGGKGFGSSSSKKESGKSGGSGLFGMFFGKK
uniref:CBM20 domain-containing protein n=1 Tax=Chlamydomonas leiostraca TaxID=1034604 RepID=A0A7S0RM30_9CHLO|mmetsp:Transcript_25636/g.65079  ORF Transcript_25636/g.65079 Transcript_25636/m.65079 type:complete len:513 (+) Transcript_25636:21-1559(+)|eukprot:CAMPEP_0202858640 /NCGR_PEP_ID=MMETSP1391-20130828/1081_1 /ASSEMBLY_ACC=CAM_ASM_000867 /TAXON_ID=1034604 /ORGANISM="Chlamydomonas leiostraca, Strain SAG 11-49" /LENGTH=512 /DNA_ID=CAMNT_0049537573 /DNA_START=17 /DNA_END=1555 /DNA_ORIENTATION=+